MLYKLKQQLKSGCVQCAQTTRTMKELLHNPLPDKQATPGFS